jgi:hypothetical protein
MEQSESGGNAADAGQVQQGLDSKMMTELLAFLKQEMRQEFKNMREEIRQEMEGLKKSAIETKKEVKVEETRKSKKPENEWEDSDFSDSDLEDNSFWSTDSDQDQESDEEIHGYDPHVMKHVTVRRSQDKRKSVVALGTEKVMVDEGDVGRTVVKVNASNRKHPDPPSLVTMDYKGLLDFSRKYEEYVRECRSLNVVPAEIVHCLTYEQREELAMGHDEDEKRNIDSDFIMGLIKEAKKELPRNKDGLIFKELAKALEGKYDLKLDNVEARARALFGALRRYLADNNAQRYFKAKSNSDDNDATSETADDLKHKRAEVVKCVIGALKPQAFREEIEAKTFLTPKYMYHPNRLYKLIIKYGKRYEYIYQRRLQLKKMREQESSSNVTVRPRSESDGSIRGRRRQNRNRSRPRGRSFSRGPTAKLVEQPIDARFVKHEGAKCEHCNEDGHYFLRYDRRAKSYVKNCPKNCDEAKFNALHSKIVQELKEKRRKRMNKRGDFAKSFARRTGVRFGNMTYADSVSSSFSGERNNSNSFTNNDNLFAQFKAFMAGYNAKSSADINNSTNNNGIQSSRSETLDNSA